MLWSRQRHLDGCVSTTSEKACLHYPDDTAKGWFIEMCNMTIMCSQKRQLTDAPLNSCGLKDFKTQDFCTEPPPHFRLTSKGINCKIFNFFFLHQFYSQTSDFNLKSWTLYWDVFFVHIFNYFYHFLHISSTSLGYGNTHKYRYTNPPTHIFCVFKLLCSIVFLKAVCHAS